MTVALVTGGTRGIGLGIARALSVDGWDLALCGIRPEQEVGDVLSQLRAGGRTVLYVPADISQPGDRAHLLSTIAGHFGGLDALVNNAGRAPRVRADLPRRRRRASTRCSVPTCKGRTSSPSVRCR
jgi:3-oxoacyl-[acyl-carrier protein] reductase